MLNLNQLNKPKGATHFVMGAWHKIGVHGKVFLHTGDNWTRSEKTTEELHRNIIKKRREDLIDEKY